MIYVKYSEKLATIISITGKKQEDLAKYFGVTFSAFNRWLHSKAMPRTKVAENIDQYLEEVSGGKKTYQILKMNPYVVKDEAIKSEQKRHKKIIDTILQYPDIRDQLILSLTYHSNKIEGSTLSEVETARVIFHNTALKNKTLVEQLEAKNHQTALLYMFECVSKNKAIDEQFILKIHSILMNSIRYDAGIYRNHSVRIVGSFVPTANHISISRLMRELAVDIQKSFKHSNYKNNFIKVTARIHARFEKIHPFSDGNGRVGRILLQAMLLKSNLAPALIVQQKRSLYYKALQKAQLKEEYEDIEEFIMDAVLAGYRLVDRR